MLSLPTVIRGGDYRFHSLADAGTIEIMMTFEGQPIVIALEVHSWQRRCVDSQRVVFRDEDGPLAGTALAESE